jgi:hypothetical protein
VECQFLDGGRSHMAIAETSQVVIPTPLSCGTRTTCACAPAQASIRNMHNMIVRGSAELLRKILAMMQLLPPPPSFRLFVSYNRRIAAGSESQVSGYFTKNPTAIVEVNGISGDEDEDSGQDPEFLEGMILEFMLTRCPVGKLYKDFKSQSWANESLARRGSLSINGDRSAAHHCVYWNASYLCALFF